MSDPRRPDVGRRRGWLSRLLAGGRIRVNEIHQERNPYFGGVNPEPIRPNIDEALGILAGGGYDLGLLLDGDADRAGAADERGTFIHQLQVTGLLMYYLAEHRGWRDPVVVSVNNTSMAARLGEHYGIATHETPVGFKFIGPKMIETGAMMGAEESGGFGFGMHLPERDGIYADLLLLDLFLRERAAGRWPVSKAIEHFHELAGPSFYRRIDVHVERAAYPETKRRLLVDLAAEPPTELAGQPVARTVAARHRRRLQVLPRRRLVAAHPDVRDRAARPRLHGGDLGRACATRCSAPASGWSAARERPSGRRPRGGSTSRGATSSSGPTPTATSASSSSSRPAAAVAPAPRGQGRVDPRPAGRLRLSLEDDAGDRPGRGARAGRAPARPDRPDPPLRGDRADASSIEVSTPELDDVVRLEDDFGREGTSAP